MTVRLPRRGYTLVLAPEGGARVECLHARDQDVALPAVLVSLPRLQDRLAELWREVLRRQAAMLTARTSDWRHVPARPVDVVVRRPGAVLEGGDVDVEEERATIRHILRLLERDGHQFGVQVRYQHLTELEAAA